MFEVGDQTALKCLSSSILHCKLLLTARLKCVKTRWRLSIHVVVLEEETINSTNKNKFLRNQH